MKKVQIQDGRAHWIFTTEEMPVWNPDHITVVDYPADGYQPVEGDLYEDGVFSPAPKQPLAFPRLSALEMLDLFTEAEQLAVVEATMSSPAVKLWYDRLIAATFVTYEDPRTEAGLQALVDAELITAQRKEEIVAAMQP